MRFELELGDASHLESLLSAVRRIDSVYAVYRLVPRGVRPAGVGR